MRYSNRLSLCPYCSTPAEDAWIVTDDAVALPHPEPLTNCHIVVAPRRHVNAFYDLDVQEQQVVWGLVREIQKRVAASLKVEGFHLGFADSTDTHTIHAHIHVVPRSPGDSVMLPDGISWVDTEPS